VSGQGSEIPLPHVASGKVRDIYELDNKHLLFVTSDRISAFDVVMAEPIPDKGRVLTAVTAFWLEQLAGVAPNHLVSLDVPAAAADTPGLEGRVMVVRRAAMLPIECIVRGYLSGSAWAEYQKTQSMHGQPLPAGLRQSEKLPEPVFTPSTKAETGHDENIDFDAAVALAGEELATEARRISLAAYQQAADYAAARGIIIADTKFELGVIDGQLCLCDEVLTPDSSRFWPADGWEPGRTPPSFDKQPLRDWLEATGWDKTPPRPVLRGLARRRRLTPRSFESAPARR
jgi:phosphoribosylaminoimidazole-succinocarboxamide synthase